MTSDSLNILYPMFERKYPELDELVTVKILDIDDSGVTCSLLEYGGIEARMSINEVSRRRFKSVRNVIKMNTQIILEVIQVDSSKGYIDLSKKSVYKDKEEEAVERYKKNKFVQNVANSICMNCNKKEENNYNVEYIYINLCYPLSAEYGSGYLGLETLHNDISLLNNFFLDEPIKKELIRTLNNKFKKEKVKIRTEIQVTCFGEDGIDAIKASLKEGLNKTSNIFNLSITVIRCPIYSLEIKSVNIIGAKNYLVDVSKTIEDKIKTFKNGGFEIISKPSIV